VGARDIKDARWQELVYYFSATGNSKCVAEGIAGALGDEARSIQGCDGRLPREDLLGLVTPTYAWGLPEIVKRFIARLSTEQPGYAFLVATYGTTPGFTGEQARRLLGERGLSLDALFSVRMPDNWTPTFDLSDPDKVAETNRRADEELAEVVGRVGRRERGDFMRRSMPYLASLVALPEYERMRKTSHFRLDDTCIGCGLCARKCPDEAIEMRDGRPVWVKERCVMCLGCLHRCPKFAIQYEDRTRKHGQYRHPGTRV
jgi:ferredoxin